MEPLLAPPHATAPTVTVDLDAITANYRYLVNYVAPAECAAVVKTNAYGLGMVPVSAALDAAGCQSFFVANAESGAQLRGVLPNARIYIFHGVATLEEAKFTAAYDLIPILNTHHQLAMWQKAAQKAGSALPAALQIDTGITRLGFSSQEAKMLAEDPAALAGVDLRLLVSHLGCSFEEGHTLTRRQLAEFSDVRSWFPGVKASLVNSAGLFFSADCRADLVRPGGALYGLNPPTAPEKPMRCVVTLHAPILQIRTLMQDETVGYSATHAATKGARIATLAIGYADGLVHGLTNAGKVWIAGYEVPVVGKVSMDLTTVDVSAIPEGAVKEGDMAEIYGPNRSFQLVAQEAGTAAYELFTSLGPRVWRRYVGGKNG